MLVKQTLKSLLEQREVAALCICVVRNNNADSSVNLVQDLMMRQLACDDQIDTQIGKQFASRTSTNSNTLYFIICVYNKLVTKYVQHKFKKIINSPSVLPFARAIRNVFILKRFLTISTTSLILVGLAK